MALPQRDWNLISSYVGLLSLATFSVYAGAHSSLKAPRKNKAADGTTVDNDDEEDEDEDLPDRISSSDAYLFPILGSLVLFGLYLVVKFLGVEWINRLLGWYFTAVGVGSVWKCSITISRALLGLQQWRKLGIWRFLMLRDSDEILALSLRTPSLVLFFPSLVPSLLYTFLPGDKKSALITDILALSFSHNALSIMKLDTFKTGIILLSGLFLYDIWWVFGTEVMVKVATSLDAPIKIIWPKSYVFSTEKGFTMLGLGDIVIPGMFVSTALRYDLSKSARKDPKQRFAKPYFRASVTAYTLGLATTMLVMHTFGAAQPALLYLSPACILSFLLTALARGELKDAWEWKDEAESAGDEITATSNSKTDEPEVSNESSDRDRSDGDEGVRRRKNPETVRR